MSDEREFATGGRVELHNHGSFSDKVSVLLGAGCWWWLPPRRPDGGMRIESERCVLTLMPVAVDRLLEQIKNGQWPPR